jgi:hypothetical protein
MYDLILPFENAANLESVLLLASEVYLTCKLQVLIHASPLRLIPEGG